MSKTTISVKITGVGANEILVITAKKFKESQQVKDCVLSARNKIFEQIKKDVADEKQSFDLEFTNDERISIYRAIIYILENDVDNVGILEIAKSTATSLRFEKQLAKRFKLGEPIEIPKGFMFDEEFEIVENSDEPEPPENEDVKQLTN